MTDEVSQNLALEGSDTVLMHGSEPGKASKVLRQSDMANIKILLETAGTTVTLGYRTSKLGSLQARSMAAAIGRVITALIKQASMAMKDFDWCGEEDLHILAKWNNVETIWEEECVHDSISKRATQHPDKPAVDAWDGRLTYRELDNLSSVLAIHLKRLGVAPETFVALCFEKSKWLVVSILAVIKAGGAYVVIEPYYPYSRMRDICTQLEVKLLLASRDLLQTASKLSDQVVVVEQDSEYFLERHDDEGQWQKISPGIPRNALYVVFSSGSTGKPKGIIVEHAAFVSWGTLLRQSLCLDAQSRVLQFSSFAFLIAHRDILLTLMFGGCVCMPSELQRLNHLETFIAQYQVNWANLTPSVAALLDPGMTPELKTLLLTSEPMSLKSLATWEGKVNLLFAYGQAESVSLCCVRRSPTVGSDRKNVGHRVGRSIWLVDPDDHNKLVPVGAVGELVMQGPVLARGYLDSERTALAFLHDVAWLQKLQPGYGGKLYKTGDLAQFADDGSVRYLSRKDNSVKLYGQRLDLDEVLQQVQRCLVDISDTEVCDVVMDLCHTSTSEDVKLTAFLGLNPTSPDTGGSVLLGPLDRATVYLQRFRSRLASVVPRYMIPTAVVIVSHIPLNLSGKTDRRKLREIFSQMTFSEVAACLGSDASHEAPCTHQELQLRSLWSQVLNTAESSIGRLDDFFRRGGDSLAAMRLASAAHGLGLGLTFGDIFANPVLSSQANMISSTEGNTQKSYTCAAFELITESQKQAVLATAAEEYALPATRIEDIYPTTPMQQGLVALNSLRPGSYVSRRVYKLEDGVSFRKLEAAWKATLNATPALRTRVIRSVDDGSTYQVVVRDEAVVDMAHDLTKYLADDEAKPLNLGAPLVRMAIISNASGEPNFCVVTMHHCIYDAWSAAILKTQVSDTYHGRVPVPQTFREFVKYVLQSNDNSSEHWRSELAGIRAEQFPALPTPTHSPNTTESESQHICFPPSVAAAANITLTTRIQLAWAMTLMAYTSVNDVVFGLTVSGRAAPVPGIYKIAGPTIATFPLRAQLRSSSSIHEELETLQRRVIEMIPFEQFGVQNISRLGDDAANACKFQSLLVIQQRQSSTKKFGIFGDTDGFTPHPMWNTYALTILCTPDADGGVRFEAVYDAAVVPKAQMRRILQVFGNILKQTVLSPDKLVGDIDSISTNDLQQIQRWNSSVPPAVPRCIDDMIHDHCASQPEATAIDAWDGQFTYKQLDEQSSLLSAVLREKGLGPDMFVPLCFEKSKWVAVAILAVAKAGSAFILLDPSHPTERLAWICKNAQAAVLLCSKDTAVLAAKLGCQHVVQVDENSSRENQSSLMTQVHHPIRALPGHALCALYTSGSTGTPKGVVIEHSAFATQVTALGPHFHLGSQSRIFQFASHAFDVAVADYVFGLALGGCVCVPNEADSRDNLAKAIRDRRANWTFLTPSVARTLRPSAVPDLNTLVIGGESAKGIDFAVWSGAVRLVYVYGPAEGTVYCTVQPKTQPGANPVNIGPAYSSACWLVEPANPEKLVAIGAVGELVIEGPIVGRGYIGDDLGGSSFIPPPKWLRAMPRSEPPGRLYRTGDLMRYSLDGDGSLEFVGRKDRQVKLRGQRMELAEIEHQVARHFPAATDAMVEIIAPQDSDSQRLLAAFIWDATNDAGQRSSNNQGTLSTSDIFAVPDEEFQFRASIAEVALRKSLPPFMNPSLFVPLKQFPLGPTGKVDRRLIKDKACSLLRRELNIYQGFCTSTMRPPSNKSESKIHQLVADVLGRDHGDIGMNDDFFQLGGDSISAMVLSARAMDMDLKLAAADILGYPRLCDMADLAIQKSTERCLPTEQFSLPEPFSLLPADYHHDTLMQEVMQQCQLGEDDVDDIYQCTPLQEGLFALTMKQPSAYVFRFTLQLTQDLDVARFENAWEAVMAANPILRTRIICATSMGGRLLQVVLRNTGYRQLVEEAGQFTVEFGHPLFSVNVLKRDNDAAGYQAAVTLHHALYDGLSLRLILTQLSAAYYQSEKTVSQPYKCFIQHCLSLPPDDEMRSFWAAELADAAGSIFTTTPVDSYLLQSPEHTECHISLSSNGATAVPLSAALKLAWGVVVSMFTGESDAVFGTVVSGRMANLRGIRTITGPTIATIPFRVRHVPTMAIQDALDEVQSRSLRMIPFEQTGLQRICQLGYADACRFQSLLIIQSKEEEELPESPLYKIQMGQHSGAFQTYPITLECTPSVGSVHIHATFDSDLIPAILVNRLLKQYAAALAYITAMPWKPVSSIPSQSINDARQVWAWNAIVPQREDSCVHDLIRNDLATRRGVPAICAWDGGFTFDELEDTSARLARHLTSLGVTVGTMVPVCFEKSRWAMVAILAVLKAGGAFVPLDVSQAAGRREAILARVGAEVVLSSAKHSAALDTAKRVVVVVDDASLKALPPQPPVTAPSSTEAVHGLATSTSAAYVFFTSGSTGEPKGVVVDHGALSTSCLAHGSRMGFSEQTRMLQFTSYTFDISLMEIFTTLLYGGCVCVPSEADRFNGLELSAEAMKVNTVSLTASVARLVEPHRMPSVESIIFVGENATDDDFRKWTHLSQVFDAYGPTECTIFCSINEIQTSSGAGSVIGKAVGSVSWVVSPDDHDKLVPIGAVGELLVEGPVLARGYLNDVEKTSAVFIEDPSWLVQGIAGYAGRRGRLYKTGDLVRYSEDGSLTYLGRKDGQVKIRGHRVEVGEVECHLRDCITGVDQAAVVPVTPNMEAAGSQLTAFLCFGNEASPSENHVRAVSLSLSTRDHLADRLPAYMLPSAYLAVGRLPLNTSGKLDRRHLQGIATDYFQRHRASADGMHKTQQHGHLAGEEEIWLPDENTSRRATLSSLPSTFRDCSSATERSIRDAWGAVLGLPSERISIDDNFYDIGGDSIRIIRLMKAIQNEFGVQLGLSLVNSRKTTIAKMAEYIERKPEMDSPLNLEGEIGEALCSTWTSAICEPWFKPVRPTLGPPNVFLTGGTGFLGTQILRTLLTSTAVERVVALVRAASVAQGLERLRSTAVTAEWWKAEYEARIDVWTGDLALERLGLNDAQWSQLSGTAAAGSNIDAIIHNGAVVNWSMDYDRLRLPNTLSTVQLLKAAALSRASPRFVFVSGGAMADLDVSPGNSAVLEQLSSRRSNGYSQSKFVAEATVRRFAARLLRSQNRFSVIKPGMIIGTADAGVANLDDFIWRVVATAARLRLYPLDADSWIPITDGGFVAARVAAQVLSDDDDDDDNGAVVSSYVGMATKYGLRAGDFWEQVNSELEHACEPAPWNIWVERALAQTQQVGESHPLWPVQEFLGSRQGKHGGGGGGISTLTPLVPPDRKTLCEAVKANVRYLGRVGFLECRHGGECSKAQPAVFHRGAAAPALNLRTDANSSVS
ncbi:hypothetical protein HIM_05122 [Hirsutella minnesotensis 3608]|uniref:Carrier domain-containing protein n=1 Tax=Hirsutella minnesotensis 3608 TaxID=1043627 RepID=A0A0F7ZKN0_9HYPO|nr:hypothetical protein HIM_05122 [Hirsutella minnesotensis 3608]